MRIPLYKLHALLPIFATSVLASSVSVANEMQIMDLGGWSLEQVIEAQDVKKQPVLGQSITIDTRDQQSCKSIQEQYQAKLPKDQLEQLCRIDKDQPYSSLIVLRETPGGQIEEYGPVQRPMNKDEISHANSLKTLMIMGVGVLFRYTTIEKHELFQLEPGESLMDSYVDNLKQGPYIDNDDFRTNYIEHPIVGSTYYLIARHKGYSKWESLGFSAFASTFMWEFGLEAIYQRPSVNDMIVTPLLGSLLGELMYGIDKHIQANDNKVLGSRKLGSFLRFITSPGYYLYKAVNKLIGEEWFVAGNSGWSVVNRNHQVGPVPREYGPFQGDNRALMFSARFYFY